MRFYNLLLHLYPRSFRDEYGAEMRAVFARAGAKRARRGAPRCGSRPSPKSPATPRSCIWDVLRQDVGYSLRVLRRTTGLRRSPPS